MTEPIPVGIRAIVKHRLVKWEGADPGCDPIGHPDCIEVIEIEDGAEPKVIYKRTEQ